MPMPPTRRPTGKVLASRLRQQEKKLSQQQGLHGNLLDKLSALKQRLAKSATTSQTARLREQIAFLNIDLERSHTRINDHNTEIGRIKNTTEFQEHQARKSKSRARRQKVWTATKRGAKAIKTAGKFLGKWGVVKPVVGTFKTVNKYAAAPLGRTIKRAYRRSRLGNRRDSSRMTVPHFLTGEVSYGAGVWGPERRQRRKRQRTP